MLPILSMVTLAFFGVVAGLDLWFESQIVPLDLALRVAEHGRDAAFEKSSGCSIVVILHDVNAGGTNPPRVG